MSTQKLERKPINFSNILLGAGLNLVDMFTITTLNLHQLAPPKLNCTNNPAESPLLVNPWRSSRPPWLPTVATPSSLPSLVSGAVVVSLDFTRVLSPGPGSKLLPRALFCFSSPLRLNTLQRPTLALETLLLGSPVVWLVVSPRPT